jgi:CubicO group peptidase (beta-lactamase class C family)
MKAVRHLMQDGLADGVFPGAALLVADKGQVMFFEVYGHARLEPRRTMTKDTVFDLASLTKPLATTVSLMILIQNGALNLDQTLETAVPGFSGTDKQDVAIRQLLSHTSGLPDYKPYYEKLVKLPKPERKSSLRGRLLAEALICEPGKVCLYSDVGFMVLQWVIEVIAQKSLDHFVQEYVYRPLGLKTLFFNPLSSGQGTDYLYAATEDCPWRGKILDGEVHDDNAYAMGGVAGHAGLFGTAQDVYALLQELLNAYTGKANAHIFDQDVVRAFFHRRTDLGSWVLGFDTPTQPDSSSGKHFSDQSVGHLGFTGTSFWIDLEKDVIVILLTNRVHPARANEKIKAFRPVLHDTVMETMGTTS